MTVPNAAVVGYANREVRRLINGTGWVVVDLTWRDKMVGPFPTRSKAEDACQRLMRADLGR